MAKKIRELVTKVEGMIDTKQLMQMAALSIQDKANEIKLNVFLKDSKAKIKEFYSDENYSKIIDMILEDDTYLTTELNASAPAAPQVDTSKMSPFQRMQLASQGQQVGGAVIPSSATAEKVLKLNFFSLYQEAHTQKELHERFPKHIITKSLEIARYGEFLASIQALELKVNTLAAKRGITSAISNEVAKKKAEIKTYHDVIALVK
jgi:hypothetical protein